MESLDSVNIKQACRHIVVAGSWTVSVTGGNKNMGLPTSTGQRVKGPNTVFACREQMLDAGYWMLEQNRGHITDSLRGFRYQ
jgi:hypothetical protein